MRTSVAWLRSSSIALLTFGSELELRRGRTGRRTLALLLLAASLACERAGAPPAPDTAARPGRNLIAAAVGPIQNLGGDIRTALALTPGKPTRLEVELPCGAASLQLGLGGRLRAGGEARFRLEIEGGGRRATVLERAVPIEDPRGAWVDLLVPLPAGAERPPCGNVVLQITGEVAAQGAPPEDDGRALARDALAVSEASVAGTVERLVMLLLIDTLRADALGAYGAERPVSPHLDRLARRSTLYTQAHAAATWTRSSVGSLFTSRLAYEHGALGRDSRLDEGLPTVAEVLGKQGVHTAAFVTNGNIGYQRLAFHRGFERWKMVEGAGRDQLWSEDSKEHYKTRGSVVLPELHAWLRMPRSRHAFVYVHTTDPHAPYAPLPPYRGLWDQGPSARLDGGFHPEHGLRSARDAAELGHVRALYDEEILLADEVSGKALAALPPGASVLVTADHGESFGENGAWEHGTTVDEVELRVPLLVRAPGFGAGRIRTETVSLLDIPATLCALFRVEPPESFAGRPLPTREGPALAVQVIDETEILGAVDGFHKSTLKLKPPASRLQFYELSKDPGESFPRPPPPNDRLASALKTIATRFRPGIALSLSGFAPGQRLRIEAKGSAVAVDAVLSGRAERDGDAVELVAGGKETHAFLQDPGGAMALAALGEEGEIWRHEIDGQVAVWESPAADQPRARFRRGSPASAPLPPPTGAELEALKSLGYVR